MSGHLEETAEKNHATSASTDKHNGELDTVSSPSSSPTSSSSSSFVPIASVQDAIQLIDEYKHFNLNILDYISAATDGQSSPNPSETVEHRIISVFGSQSTGKSTLLNALFNTNFGVMDEINRQQTTKGIWLALSPGVNHSVDTLCESRDQIIVMDVEGTDGRERGEDQDFERKAALFAMATSEVLIVNMWESQVGLYQGANMGLLKTVFEVNLSLFGSSKLQKGSTCDEHKVLLLFVIRDHIGVTPKESLAATITQDLLKIWDSLSKPAEVSHFAFEDFFDVAFHTLSHKVLQKEKFVDDVKLLGNRFIDSSNDQFLFKPVYHHDIPIEGWTMYAENCWEQIDNNKDLDLPTQQILVAKFKCDEIVTACYSNFLEKFEPVKEETLARFEDSTFSPNYNEIGCDISQLKNETLLEFHRLASKYNSSVYEQRRAVLDEKVNAKLGEILSLHAKALLKSSLVAFSQKVSKKPRKGSFTETIQTLTDALRLSFAENLAFISLNGQLSTNEYAEALEAEISKLVEKQQVVELNSIVEKHTKRLANALKMVISDEISNPSNSSWDHILKKFKEVSASTLEKYTDNDGLIDFKVGTDIKLCSHTQTVLEFKSWDTLHALIHKYISKDNFLDLLKDRFDDKFRYDQNGLPRLYQNTKELETNFAEAKSYAMIVFPIFSFARLFNGEELQAKFDVTDKNLKRKYSKVVSDFQEEDFIDDPDSSDDDSEESKIFAEILTETERSFVLAKFKREIDAKFVETKRSIVQHVTKIPYYIYLVILVLGWNEFVAVIRNPLFFTLIIIFGAGIYVMYSLNLLAPALLMSQKMFDEALLVAKQKLREFVVDDEQAEDSTKKGMTKDDIELDTFSSSPEEPGKRD